MSDRNRLFEALQLMSKRNDVIQDTHGNVSCRAENDCVWIKPSGVPYDQIQLMDICAIRMIENGWEPYTTSLKPSVDTVHHVNIYKNSPHIRAICHTHSPYVVAHAIALTDIVCMSTEQADYFGDTVYCYDYSDLNSWGRHLHVSPSQKAVLLGSHGALTFADDPVKAVNLAIQLENVARKNFLAKQLRSGIRPLNEYEVEKWHERFNNVYGQK